MRRCINPAAEHAVDAGGADGDDIGVEHHEGQAPIAFQRVRGTEVDDRLLLPALEPAVARDLGVVLVGLAVAQPPAGKLARGKPDPGYKTANAKPRALRPVGREIDHRVPHVMSDPDHRQLLQLPPSSFFNRTISAAISARTSSFSRSLPSSCEIFSPGSEAARFRGSKGRFPILKRRLLPLVKKRRVNAVFLAYRRERAVPPADAISIS